MSTGEIIWIISLVIALVVIFVVGFLLKLTDKTAKEINKSAAKIWDEGKMTASNTVHIPLFLTTTNAVVKDILSTAVEIVGGVKSIKQHTEGCPGCPSCILDHYK
tara:strand:- start:2734 stop:3048 length:315 start_codon:yes stop_codon:yes gene_type:complete